MTESKTDDAMPKLLTPRDWKADYAARKDNARPSQLLRHAADCSFRMDEYPARCTCGLWDWRKS